MDWRGIGDGDDTMRFWRTLYAGLTTDTGSVVVEPQCLWGL